NTKVYTIDMTDGDSILNSPAFYLRQNDVVYVEANNFRKRQSIASGNTAYSPSFWISVASFCMSVYVIFIR
ncbi:MAG: polysaccharide export protein, partial [Bacteroidales bacterium]|nr:polysaccharide export protein [Bacteroidales bacterium]